MVPVQALEQTALQFIGHGWGCWGKGVGVEDLGPPPASWRQIYGIVWPALWSLGSALGFEVPMAVFLSVIGGRPFALYINGAEEMAAAGTAYMWRSIDWCYIFYAMSTQLAHSPARYEAETVSVSVPGEQSAVCPALGCCVPGQYSRSSERVDVSQPGVRRKFGV